MRLPSRMWLLEVLECGHWHVVRCRECWPSPRLFPYKSSAEEYVKERRPEATSVRITRVRIIPNRWRIVRG